jgi:hypothetical protein
VERSLLESMSAKTYYKDAYRAAAERVRQFATLIGQSVPGGAPAMLEGANEKRSRPQKSNRERLGTAPRFYHPRLAEGPSFRPARSSPPLDYPEADRPLFWSAIAIVLDDLPRPSDLAHDRRAAC